MPSLLHLSLLALCFFPSLAMGSNSVGLTLDAPGSIQFGVDLRVGASVAHPGLVSTLCFNVDMALASSVCHPITDSAPIELSINPLANDVVTVTAVAMDDAGAVLAHAQATIDVGLFDVHQQEYLQHHAIPPFPDAVSLFNTAWSVSPVRGAMSAAATASSNSSAPSVMCSLGLRSPAAGELLTELIRGLQAAPVSVAAHMLVADFVPVSAWNTVRDVWKGQSTPRRHEVRRLYRGPWRPVVAAAPLSTAQLGFVLALGDVPPIVDHDALYWETVVCRTVPGSVIVVERFFGFLQWWATGTAARWQRVVKDSGVGFRFLGFSGTTVAVLITSPPDATFCANILTLVPSFPGPRSAPETAVVDRLAGVAGDGGMVDVVLSLHRVVHRVTSSIVCNATPAPPLSLNFDPGTYSYADLFVEPLSEWARLHTAARAEQSEPAATCLLADTVLHSSTSTQLAAAATDLAFHLWRSSGMPEPFLRVDSTYNRPVVDLALELVELAALAAGPRPMTSYGAALWNLHHHKRYTAASHYFRAQAMSLRPYPIDPDVEEACNRLQVASTVYTAKDHPRYGCRTARVFLEMTRPWTLEYNANQVRHLMSLGILLPGWQDFVSQLTEAAAYVRSLPDDSRRPVHLLNRWPAMRDYMGSNGMYIRPSFPLPPGTPILGDWDRAAISSSYTSQAFGIVVIDNLLSPAVLSELYSFMLESRVFRDASHPSGQYLGGYKEFGFASPLVLQVAEELRLSMPDVFEQWALVTLWAYVYPGEGGGLPGEGIGIHADQAAINVNVWLTPEHCNLNKTSGGLRVWREPAPLDWSFERFNTPGESVKAALNASEEVVVPFRNNRAVLFNSNLFHQTDKFTFKDTFKCHRINLTLLFGPRVPQAVKK